MKRSVPFLLAFVIALCFAGAASAQSTDFCMDCIHRLVEAGDEVRQDAECCMAIEGHCYKNDWMKDTNVGYGCKVSSPDTRSWTFCASTQEDKNCPQQGGADKKHQAGFQGDQGCVYDSTGWCDIACRTCTWG